MDKAKEIVDFIKKLYKKDFVPLHEPVFMGNEKKYVNECIDSTFVSSVGEFVNRVEERLCEITGSKYAIATVNGTSALHIALKLSGVKENTEVITQPLTFVATCNAIKYCGAEPVFVDVDKETLGMSAENLKYFLDTYTERKDGKVFNKITKKEIAAILPMHTFGHPCEIDKIIEIANEYNLPVVEDAAESLGSLYRGKHTGTFGLLGVLSFNGNKITTAGGGGVILTNNEELAKKAKHLTTTAKIPHKWEYCHDEVGYNYRMPNINAALLLGQLENLNYFVNQKRKLAKIYKDFFSNLGIDFITEPKNAYSNYWLNAILLKNKEERDKILEMANSNNIQTRPVWTLMYKLPMYKDCFKI
ncbi:MAG: LegC family aminotransferase, partial [Aquificae bacterium]|nr:LegC family aminotransferase [Aquificota bacterium]